MWLASQLQLQEGSTGLRVRSVKYNTAYNPKHKDSSGLLFCSLLSPFRAMEWIYVDSLRPINSWHTIKNHLKHFRNTRFSLCFLLIEHPGVSFQINIFCSVFHSTNEHIVGNNFRTQIRMKTKDVFIYIFGQSGEILFISRYDSIFWWHWLDKSYLLYSVEMKLNQNI